MSRLVGLLAIAVIAAGIGLDRRRRREQSRLTRPEINAGKMKGGLSPLSRRGPLSTRQGARGCGMQGTRTEPVRQNGTGHHQQGDPRELVAEAGTQAVIHGEGQTID